MRAEARDIFVERLRASGATRSYLTDMTVNIWGTEAGGHRDHVAESVVLGGGLVSFTSGRPRTHDADHDSAASNPEAEMTESEQTGMPMR